MKTLRRCCILMVLPALALTIFSCRLKMHVPPSDESVYETIIIGAGLSGLTSGYYLRDKNIILLEPSKQAGGNILCGHWQGYYYSHGPLYFYEPEPALQQFISDLDLVPVKIQPPLDATATKLHIYAGSQLLDYMTPAEQQEYFLLHNTFQDYKDLGVKSMLLNRPGELTAYSDLDVMSAESWMLQNNISSGVATCLGAKNRSLMGTTNRQQSFLFDIPALDDGLQIPEDSAVSNRYTFPGGMGDIIDKLASTAGSRLVTNTLITSIQTGTDSLVTVNYTQEGVSKTIRGRTLILTIPAPQAAVLLTSGISTTARSLLQSIQYAPLISVNLFTSSPVLTKTWSVTFVENSIVSLYDELRSQAGEGNSGKGILTLHLAPSGPADTNFLSRSDEDILNQAYAELATYYPDFHNKVEGMDIHRMRYFQPVTGPNYRVTLNGLHQEKSLHGPIFLAGDYLVYPSVEGAYFSGYHAAQNVRIYLDR